VHSPYFFEGIDVKSSSDHSNMTREKLLPTLLDIARDVTGEDDLEFTAQTPFEDIEEWDSLNHVHMVVGMEDTFGIRFNDPSRLQAVVKVQDLLDIIADLKGL
jgi:acyl carrier protein